MGVRELWTVLAPVKEELPLSSLAGKRIAVDISGWVCQASSIPSLKPHLRQVFVRVSRLCREGVWLVVVLDGEAIPLKWAAMDTRARAIGRGVRQRTTGQRSILNRLIKECKELLDLLGVPYLQSVGEAEALCGLLNKEGLVDGVLTQDGDAFLYGATVIYKDLSITDSTVDCYTASRVETELGLTRRDLVSLALLIGCDYCPQGVPGVGQAAALKFIVSCKPHDSLDVLRRLASSSEGSEGKVQRLSRGVPGFPNEDIIKEFMVSRDRLSCGEHLSWLMPLVQGIQLFFKRQLEWPVESTCAKARVLLTHWVMSRKGRALELKTRDGEKCSIHPICVVKERKEKKLACFEVKWNAQHRLAGNAEEFCDDLSTVEFTTIEKAQIFESTYPDICEIFELAKREKQKPPKKGKSKGKKLTPLESPSKLSQSILEDHFSPKSDHTMKQLTSDKLTANHSTDSKSELIPLAHREPSVCFMPTPSSTPLQSTASRSVPAPSPLSHPTSVIQVDSSDSDDEPSLVEILQLHKHKHQQVTHTTVPLVQDTTLSATCTRSSPILSNTSPDLPTQLQSRDSSDEEELPLFSRLRKSPIKASETSPTVTAKAQVQLDSYFHQKKSAKQSKKKSRPNGGSKDEPILID